MTDTLHAAAVLLAQRTAEYAAEATVAVMRMQGHSTATLDEVRDDMRRKVIEALTPYIEGELQRAADEARADA